MRRTHSVRNAHLGSLLTVGLSASVGVGLIATGVAGHYLADNCESITYGRVLTIGFLLECFKSIDWSWQVTNGVTIVDLFMIAGICLIALHKSRPACPLLRGFGFRLMVYSVYGVQCIFGAYGLLCILGIFLPPNTVPDGEFLSEAILTIYGHFFLAVAATVLLFSPIAAEQMDREVDVETEKDG